MRKYNVSDVFTVVGMLKKVTALGSDKLSTLLSAAQSAGEAAQSDREGEAASITAVIAFALGEIYGACKDDLAKWFASLSEMSLDQFNAQPPEAVLDLIDEIATREDTKDFFSRASALYRKITGSGTHTASA